MLRRTSLACAILLCCAASLSAQNMAGMQHEMGMKAGWRMPPMDSLNPPMPGLETALPVVSPYLPGDMPAAHYDAAVPSRPIDLANGDTLRLESKLVRRTINGKELVMFGFNGQYPGPLIRVKQNSTIVVRFTNHVDWPSAVHWHGVRLDNASDGVPDLTQKAVEPGETFVYHVHFKDAGIYWYHPHHREDVQQDLGLYGNIMVASADPGYWNPVNREATLMLDDLLVDSTGIAAYGRESPVFALMGRFGNVLLVNGEPKYSLRVSKGDVVRFFLTNASSTRTFNISFGDARIKLVATDAGRYEREQWVESVVIGPAERYVVEVRFPDTGAVRMLNRVQVINHPLAEFSARTDTLGTVSVAAAATVRKDYGPQFEMLRSNASVKAEIDRVRASFTRAPEHELHMTLKLDSLLPVLAALMAYDTSYFHPVEWTDPMPMMNWLMTGRQVKWELRDAATGKINDDIAWHFKRGDVVKIRLVNDAAGMLHAMQHPIHFHGQRFLVLSRDGVENDDHAWKDTVLVPVGSTVDILLELSNPGKWMAHCHIAEHLSTGMKMVFTVE
jgi:suppressor of ftsI